MSRLGVGFCVALFFPLVALAQPVKRDDLKPGLIFTVTDAAPAASTLSRLEPTVGLTLFPKHSAHPQSTGGQTFRWQGHISIITPGKYTFDGTLLGQLSVSIAGREVFAGTVEGNESQLVQGKEVTLEPGILSFEAVLVRKGDGVRAELTWKGPGFRREPIPHFFFGHLPKNRPQSFGTDLKREHGRFLFEEMACIRCHSADANDAMAKTIVERTGPNLSEIGRRVYPGWLDTWLKDPKSHRPQTTMPAMFANDAVGAAERYAVTAYLTSLGGPLTDAKSPKVNAKDLRDSETRGSKLYITAGCAACHGEQVTAPPTKKGPKDDEDEKEPLKPEDSIYGLGTKGGAQSYYTLGYVGSKTRPEALAQFLSNPLATNPHGRMPAMTLTNAEALDIARFLCRNVDPKISSEVPAEPQEAPGTLVDKATAAKLEKLKRPDMWKEAGKWLVSSKGCVNCHVVAPGGTALPVKAKAASPLSAIAKLPEKGCIGGAEAPATTPKFGFTPDQQEALKLFLTTGLTGPGSLSAVHSARTAIKRFNCMNCHSRDGEGGIESGLSEKMKSLENAQNADDVQPPRLTGVGHKMRTTWMREVLVNAGRARPWMTLRMPQYGKENVDFLADALPLLEGTTTDDTIGKAVYTAEKLDTGRTLAGKSGHGCISCHDISGVTGGGTRGPDLATTNKRVRFDWYVRWMHQPQRMAPGTKMPQAFIDGKALLDSIYAGDGDKQIEALWAYFSIGPGLPLPSGLEPPKGLIVASTGGRPEIMRTFIPGDAGTKGVAIAFPTGVNMVFDTTRARLAYSWSGNFLDMTPVWVSRGGNQAKVLGQKFWTAPEGTPWAMTDSRETPDFNRQAKDPAYGANMPDGKFYFGKMAVKSLGYTLNSNAVPTFRYAITPAESKNSLVVSETPEPAKVSVAYGISRKFKVEVPAGKTAWFHAADTTYVMRVETAEKTKVELKDQPEFDTPALGARLIAPIDGVKVQVLQVESAPPGTAWRISKRKGGGWDIALRLPEAKDNSTVDIVLNAWSLPKDDEKLLEGLR